jgi:hypothetical protein
VEKKKNMYRKIVVILAVYFLCLSYAQAQKVYKVKYESQADIKVYIVDYESQADLKVYFVEYESRACKDGLWYPVQYESRADIKVYFVNYESQADLKIYIVDYESQAGWRNNQKQHLLKFKN